MSGPIATAASRSPDPTQVAAELKAALGTCEAVFVFHAIDYDAQALAEAIQAAFPDACTLGCSSYGEIGPFGMTRGGVSAIGLRRDVRCAARVLSPEHTFNQGAAVIEAMAQELGTTTAGLEHERHLILTLADGRSRSEERTVAALAFAAPAIRLVGGSASNNDLVDLNNSADFTRVFLNGQVHDASHLVVLLELDIPFEVLHVHHFRPTERRVVITRADPSRRRVGGLDGWRPEQVIHSVFEIAPDSEGDPTRFASQPVQLAYIVSGEVFVRSVLGEEAGELVMAGAVEEGSVMRVVRGDALVERTREGIASALEAFPGKPAGMLLFNCVNRLMEAERQFEADQLYEAMAQTPVAGFHTYGEQLDRLHINHTLTGVIFGE